VAVVGAAAANVTVRVWKMTYASSDPDAAANFTVDVLGATHIPHSGTLSDKCGTVRWVEFGRGGFQASRWAAQCSKAVVYGRPSVFVAV
jgi:hypothetical protein